MELALAVFVWYSHPKTAVDSSAPVQWYLNDLTEFLRNSTKDAKSLRSANKMEAAAAGFLFSSQAFSHMWISMSTLWLTARRAARRSGAWCHSLPFLFPPHFGDEIRAESRRHKNLIQRSCINSSAMRMNSEWMEPMWNTPTSIKASSHVGFRFDRPRAIMDYATLMQLDWWFFCCLTKRFQ